MTGRFYFYFCPTGDICIKALLYEKNIEVVKVWTPGIRGGRKWRQREAKRAKHSVLDQTDGRTDGRTDGWMVIIGHRSSKSILSANNSK